MSVSYGFYNASDHDRRYNALQMSQIFDGIISNGVYETLGGALMVKAYSGMVVNVQTGRAWFDRTWTYNDAVLPLTIDESDRIVSRIDAVVIKIDSRRSVRMNSIEIVKGTPARVPSKPSMDTGSDEIFMYPLAYITVGSSVTEITQSNIENCVGTSACPFVTGIIETMDVDELIAQWKSQWDDWFTAQDARFNDYMDSMETSTQEWRDEFVENTEAWKGRYVEAAEEWKNEFIAINTAWEVQQKEDFAEWFKTVQYVMDGDVAGHLQNEIDDINSKIDEELEKAKKEVDDYVNSAAEVEFKRYYELVNRVTEINQNGIVETSDEAVCTTTITETDTGKVITTLVVPTTGIYKYTKTTTIISSESGKTITEEYTKEVKI